MSFYGTRNNSTTERGQRNRTSQRKDSSDRYEANANGNNNNEVSRGIDSYISNYTRSAGNSHRSSTSRNPGGLRMKSNLVGSMTATFEQLKVKDSLPPSGSSAVKSTPYSTGRVDGLPLPGQRIASSGNKLENGIDHPPKPNVEATQKYDNGMDRKNDDIDDDDAETKSSQRSAKPSSSARRGKQQREKRMLRQKRRSTGVVRLKGSDDEDEDKSAEKTQNTPDKDKEITRKLETEKNTLSNELSPPPSAHNGRSENENKTRSPEASEPSNSKQYSTSSSLLSPTQPDNVFLSSESAPQSPNVPSLNSSRRRGKRTSDLSQQDNKEEVEELRKKLAAAEATIGNLMKEVEDLETDIKQLAEENHNLKYENKLLEDENSSMLMVLKQLRNNKE